MSAEDSVICTICSEAVSKQDQLSGTNCGHVYHSKCIIAWTERSHSCPQCCRARPTLVRLYLSFDDESTGNRLIREQKNTINELNGKLHETEAIADSLRNQVIKLQENLQESQFILESARTELDKSMSAEEKLYSLELKNIHLKHQIFDLQTQLTLESKCRAKLISTAKDLSMSQREVKEIQEDLNSALKIAEQQCAAN